MGITVLHTADWQIGKQFKHVPGDPGAALRLQRLETVKLIAAKRNHVYAQNNNSGRYVANTARSASAVGAWRPVPRFCTIAAPMALAVAAVRSILQPRK